MEDPYVVSIPIAHAGEFCDFPVKAGVPLVRSTSDQFISGSRLAITGKQLEQIFVTRAFHYRCPTIHIFQYGVKMNPHLPVRREDGSLEIL